MNSLDEVRVAGEGLKRGRLIASEECRDIVLLHIQIWEVEPGQGVFQVTPDALNRVQLGAIGWQEHEAHVRRQGEPLRRVGATVVQQSEIQAVREGLREAIDEELEHLGVQIGQLQEEAVPRRWQPFGLGIFAPGEHRFYLQPARSWLAPRPPSV